MPRTTLYRRRQASVYPPLTGLRPIPKRALSPEERQKAMDVLHNSRCRLFPAQIYATLLDAADKIPRARELLGQM